MKLAKTLSAAAIIGALGFAETGDAQSNDALRDSRPNYQASVGITIPFGTSSNKVKDQPRLEFTTRRMTNSHYDIGWAVSDDYIDQSIGLSLSKKPSLMMNGREVQFGGDETANLSDTMEWVLIGAVLVGAVIVAGTLTPEEAEAARNLNR